MAFLETPTFPELLARGITCGPSFSTRVVVTRAGAESRNANWSRVRWFADAASAVRTMADLEQLERFFYAVGGRLNGFRLRDPADYEAGSLGATPVLVPLDVDGDAIGTAGAGYGVPVYQLAKNYAAGALAHNRWITKPRSGVTLTRDGSPVTLGAGAGQAAVSTTTGRVTFVADQSRSISAHSVGSTHLLDLASGFSPAPSVGDRVYVSGCGGADADEINGQSWQITEVASSGDLRIALASTGMTITGGTAYLYPQASEALAWSGEFDVPVRFDTDRLDRQLLFRQLSGGYVAQVVSIPLVEVRDA